MSKLKKSTTAHREQRLTKTELIQLEQGEKTPFQKAVDFLILFLPVFSFGIAQGEYWLLPDRFNNAHPERYSGLLSLFAIVYGIFWLKGLWEARKSNPFPLAQLRYKAPLYSAVYLFLTLYDYLTLKTGILLQPFIPWVNDILNVAWADRKNLLISTVFTLRLLFTGYFVGVIAGLITGIACGYSRKIRYWIDPLIKVLGPIPTATWIPLIMILARSLYNGSVFIVSLGTWFSVTVASMSGISTVDRSFYDCAKTLGAKGTQLILHVAIPHAMPSILAGMTTGMSSACISLMIAEMMGVEAGLGWYITWAKAWAAYNKMFAAIILICLTFNGVTRILDAVKHRVLRWQEA